MVLGFFETEEALRRGGVSEWGNPAETLLLMDKI